MEISENGRRLLKVEPAEIKPGMKLVMVREITIKAASDWIVSWEDEDHICTALVEKCEFYRLPEPVASVSELRLMDRVKVIWHKFGFKEGYKDTDGLVTMTMQEVGQCLVRVLGDNNCLYEIPDSMLRKGDVHIFLLERKS